MRSSFSPQGVQTTTLEQALEIVGKIGRGEKLTTEEIAILVFHASESRVQEALARLQKETPLE